MKTEYYTEFLKKGHFEPLYIDLLNASGWAGVLPNGNIVDRRYFPEAVPVQKNSLFGVSEPRDIPKES